MISSHLACHDDFRDRLKQPHRAAQFTLGNEEHPCPGAVRLERPRSVDRVRTLDDVGSNAHRSVELGELDDLLDSFPPGGFVRSRTRVPSRGAPSVSASTDVLDVCQSARVDGFVR